MGRLETVKGSRKERARQTRKRMLTAAYELFCDQGYAPSTMAAIARRARVAVQTLHFTFHTKAQLLAEVMSVYASGADEGVPVIQRDWMQKALADPDPVVALGQIVDHGTDIYVRLAPLKAAVDAAASVDDEVAKIWRNVGRGRKEGMRTFIQTLADRGSLASGLSVERATDLLYVLQSHEVFLGLTAGCGWSVEEFKTWQLEHLRQQLLRDGTGPR